MASAPGPWRAQRSKSRGRKDLQLEVIHFRYHPYQTKKLNTLIYFVLFLERWGWRVGGSSLSTGCATAPRLMSSGLLHRPPALWHCQSVHQYLCIFSIIFFTNMHCSLFTVQYAQTSECTTIMHVVFKSASF